MAKVHEYNLGRALMGTLAEFPQCDECKHLNDDGWTCPAFPEGIPNDIFDNDFDHHKPFPGDRGIQFEPRESDEVRPFEILKRRP